MKKEQSHRDLNRRELLRLGGAAALIGSTLMSPAGVKRAVAEDGGGGSCSGSQIIEAWPSSPLILSPFSDPLPIPTPLAPCSASDVASWSSRPGPGFGQQDSYGGTHQIWPSQLGLPDPLIYNIKLQLRQHSFTTSKVQALKNVMQNGSLVIPAGSIRSLPASNMYTFNGTFPGPMIYAQYGQPNLVRFENHLDENPYNLDRNDFGAPDWAFLTHLHNGHTAPESDGNPHHQPGAYKPGQYVDNLYLNYPAGGDEREKQSFFWFHDHRMDHTGANVYKGMVGLYPIYDPILDPGDETKGLRLPGVPNAQTGRVDYDIPLAFYDCALDDGATPHKDFHNGCGEVHPEWWGQTFFRHFPDHGFVGDVFTVNGTAYPVLVVNRRKYRFRFLDCSISRIYELKLMAGHPVASPGIQGQYLLPDGQQCMRFTQIAADGGLLSQPVVRDSFQIWPAKRKEMVVDFTTYQDGSPTRKGDVIYMTNVCKMTTGRMPDSPDSSYKVPMIKIVIGDDAPDNSQIPARLRDLPPVPTDFNGLPTRNFTFQRGSAGGEIQWMVNGKPFDPTVPLAYPVRGSAELWTFQNGGGGWVHPVHIHQEEHHIVSRSGGMGPEDPYCKEDVVALGPSETVTFYRKFRTFTGKYVAHCHNLAHEDHAMMFGWQLMP